MNQISNKPFILKPPTHAPVADDSVTTTSSLPPEPVPLAKHILDLSQRGARKPTANQVPVLPSAPAEQALTPAEQASESAKDMIPGSGPSRDSFFSRFMGSFAEDSSNAVDPQLLAALNDWLRRVVVTHTTAETALRDFGHAMSEKGVAIDAKLTQMEEFVQELIWIRNMRQLMQTLALPEYADVVIARVIEKEFGRALEAERDIAKAKADKADMDSFMTSVLTSMAKSLADLREAQTPAKQVPPSPFRAGATPRRVPAPAPKAPVVQTPAAPQAEEPQA